MNLTAYLKANGAEFEFVEKATTHHATEASRASGIPLEQIAKTIVFADDAGRLIVGVVLGNHMVSRHKLETCSGSKRLEVAADMVAEKATGYPTGGIPPVGHHRRLPTRLVRLRVSDILRLSGARVCDIAIAES